MTGSIEFKREMSKGILITYLITEYSVKFPLASSAQQWLSRHFDRAISSSWQSRKENKIPSNPLIQFISSFTCSSLDCMHFKESPTHNGVQTQNKQRKAGCGQLMSGFCVRLWSSHVASFSQGGAHRFFQLVITLIDLFFQKYTDQGRENGLIVMGDMSSRELWWWAIEPRC